MKLVITKTFTQIEERVRLIKESLIEKINSLPDNHRIKRLSTSPSCFVVKWSDLGNDWTPKYHDFKCQYRFICGEIEKKDLSKIIPFLEEIIEKGKIRIKEYRGGDSYYTFHKDVRNHLIRLLYSHILIS